MRTGFYKLLFILYKLLVRPLKRTPARWLAVIFNAQGEFVLEQSSGTRRLPSGRIVPGDPIPSLCRRALGLDASCFSEKAPLRLIGITGRGGGEMCFYYAGEVSPGIEIATRLKRSISYAGRSELGSFIPADIEDGLRSSRPSAGRG